MTTNKLLALVGRLEARDWVDIIACSERIQHLGYLAWAACGKDPGYGPMALLAEARRSSRYSADEIAALAFDGPPPNARDLSLRWVAMLREAEAIIEALPSSSIGEVVLDRGGELFRGTAGEAAEAAQGGQLLFHRGSIRGAHPTLVG